MKNYDILRFLNRENLILRFAKIIKNKIFNPDNDFLDILGVFTPSISAIYILDFFYLKKQHYDLDEIEAWGMKGLLSWGMSSIVALYTYFDVFQLTHAHFTDSFLLGGLIYVLLNRR